MNNFANNLRTLRLNRHMSQKELAKRVNVTSSVISAYENQIRMPSYDVLIKIADIFGCSCDYLLGRESFSSSKRKTIDVTNLTDKQVEALQFIMHAFKDE